jgi:hypothetical protein
VGDHLDDVGLAGRQGEEDSRREEDEENHGDKNVGVEHLYSKNIFLQQHTLMVKALVQTASRIVQLHRDIGPCLVRIQTGFLKDKNIQSTERMIDEVEAKLRDLRRELKCTQTNDYVPLK